MTAEIADCLRQAEANLWNAMLESERDYGEAPKKLRAAQVKLFTALRLAGVDPL
jgi:hypothetical protein